MKPGPKRKPTVLKKNQGTYRKDRANQNEPEFKPLKVMPKPPVYLGKVAKKTWKEIGPLLIEQSLLSNVNLIGFEMYCQAYDVVRELDITIIRNKDYIKETKTGYPVLNPMVNQRHKFAGEVLKWAVAFGMTPHSSNNVNAIPTKQKETREDKLKRTRDDAIKKANDARKKAKKGKHIKKVVNK